MRKDIAITYLEQHAKYILSFHPGPWTKDVRNASGSMVHQVRDAKGKLVAESPFPQIIDVITYVCGQQP